MDIASLIGLLAGSILLVATIAIAPGARFGAFIDYPSMMLVIGGCFSAVLICFPLKSVFGLFKVFKKVFFNKPEEFQDLIDQVVSLAETARREGLLALEGRLEEITNPFMILGIQMAVDGTRPQVIESVMRTEMDAVATRHRNGKSVLDQMGRFAPAFGMIGTLMGLIIMLGNMDDPSKIGPGMAVALITTLYGAISSNLIFLPCAEKLGYISRHELLTMEIILRGIMGIQSGDNPRVIGQTLSTFVPPAKRRRGEEV